MIRVKVKYEAPKQSRIKRFARSIVSLNEGTERYCIWAHPYEKFTTPKGDVFVKRIWEDEKLKNGELCYTVAGYKKSGLSNNVHAFRAKTVRTAKRKIFNIARFFPTGTTFEDFAGWIGAGVTFTVTNTEYDEAKLKDELYKDLKLGRSWQRLSDVEYINNIVIALRNVGYFVSVSKIPKNEYYPESYWSCYVIGKGLRAAFCTENESSYTSLNNKIAADRDDNFDKWSRCDYESELPTTQEGINELLEDLTDLLNTK